MIPAIHIKNIFDTLAVYLGVPVYRANQTKQTEDIYPHGIYNILSDQNEHAYQNILDPEVNPIDPTIINRNLYEKSKITISLIFADKNRIDRIATLAMNAMHWFKSDAGQDFCKSEDNILVNLINNNVQDRTIWIEHLNWENRYGFDLNFWYVNQFVDTVEAIETIDLIPSFEGTD